jgi:hypothetical protein
MLMAICLYSLVGVSLHNANETFLCAVQSKRCASKSISRIIRGLANWRVNFSFPGGKGIPPAAIGKNRAATGGKQTDSNDGIQAVIF